MDEIIEDKVETKIDKDLYQEIAKLKQENIVFKVKNEELTKKISI